MGFNADAKGKPVYSDTPTQTVADLQAAADFADSIGGLLKLTASEVRGRVAGVAVHVGRQRRSGPAVLVPLRGVIVAPS